MSENQPHPLALRLFGAAAVIGIAGWVGLLALWGWWSLQPVALPTVTEPMPVLNPNREVAIGDPLLLQLDVVKQQELDAVGTSRYLACESSNLVTLTSMTAINLPVGEYTVIADSIVLPAKITPGDVCRAVISVTYHVNPIRDDDVEFTSEPFTVLPAEEKP